MTPRTAMINAIARIRLREGRIYVDDEERRPPEPRLLKKPLDQCLSNLYFTGHMERVSESGATVREAIGQPTW